MEKPHKVNETTKNVIQCPSCGEDLTLPEDLQDGRVLCEKCDASYFFGRKPQQDSETVVLAERYYKFIAPEMIALNKKALLFNEMYPEAELLTEEGLQETLETIAELEKLLNNPEEPTA